MARGSGEPGQRDTGGGPGGAGDAGGGPSASSRGPCASSDALASPDGGLRASRSRLQISFEGLELYGRHGVADEEQALGQRFVVDAAVTPLEADLSDELDRTVSYVSLMEVAEEVVTGRSFRLIESLAEAIAEEMLARFPVGRVWVRVGKPHAPVRFAVRGVFAEVELSRPGR